MKAIAMAVIIGFIFIGRGFAQDQAGPRVQHQVSVPAPSHPHQWGFRSQTYGGFVTGQAGNYGNGYTINGVRFRSWFLGAGAGLDCYRFRTVPIFLSLEKEWIVGGNGLFARVDGGRSLPRQDLADDVNPISAFTQKLETGSYWNGIAGYKIFLNARHREAVLISAGYSFKKSVVGTHTLGGCPGCFVSSDGNYNYNFYNRRASFNLGFQF